MNGDYGAFAVSIALMAAILFLGFFVGLERGKYDAAQDCELFGKFEVNGKTYLCQRGK